MELKEIIDLQVNSKVSELASWKNVRWEGGRLYYETQRILQEISEYTIETKIFYLETLLNKQFILQDNLPGEAPDITQSLKDWLVKNISGLKVRLLESTKEFLSQELDEISLKNIQLDNSLIEILDSRIQETERCLKAQAYLSVIILTGSIIEGLLLGYAKKFPKSFNNSNSAPKDKENKTKAFRDWTMNDFINVSSNLEILNEDVKKHSHSVREFRNYIHPNQQLHSRFNPDENTAKISWQVLKACVMQLVENKDKLE